VDTCGYLPLSKGTENSRPHVPFSPGERETVCGRPPRGHLKRRRRASGFFLAYWQDVRLGNLSKTELAAFFDMIREAQNSKPASLRRRSKEKRAIRLAHKKIILSSTK
jgi:hypothetical protein